MSETFKIHEQSTYDMKNVVYKTYDNYKSQHSHRMAGVTEPKYSIMVPKSISINRLSGHIVWLDYVGLLGSRALLHITQGFND